MKKTLSVLLAVLFAFMSIVPAFATETENETETPETENVTLYNVTFYGPEQLEQDAYKFVKTKNGEIEFVEDPAGIYCIYNEEFYVYDKLIPQYQAKASEERYSVVEWDPVSKVAEGETVSFKILTSDKYNVLTAVVIINGEVAKTNAYGEYTVYVDRDISVSVMEYNENGEVLLRNHFNVKLTTGDGYKTMTLKDKNYRVVYYGESFYFRVKILSGYSAAGIKVSVQRGPGMLDGILDEDDDDLLGGLLGNNEILTSYGVDEDGCRLYRIDNITTDCKIIVDGLQEESNVGIMAMFKRIIRLILDFLGIKLDILESITAYYTVKIDAAQLPEDVTYEVVRSTNEDYTPSEFTVTTGDGISIVVTKTNPDTEINVMWTPGNELGTYETEWHAKLNSVTGKVTYTAVYNIDNISADTTIVLS